MILFTGDLIDVHPDVIPEHVQELAKLDARFGKFAVSGNHDVMTGLQPFYELCQTLGFVCLDHAQATVGHLRLIGMPDEMAGRFPIPEVPHWDPSQSVIFLKHRPTRFKEAVQQGVHLQLSGHSHKGQLPPWGILVKMRYNRFAYGLHAYKRGHIYTSSGTGVWGPPMRLFSRSEIVKILL